MNFENESEIQDVYICTIDRNHGSDNESEFENETINTKKSKNINSSILKFLPFKHKYLLHKASVLLSSTELESQDSSIFYIFSQFFSAQLINTIVQNTNIYANSKIAKNKNTGRKWDSLTVSEFKIWLALVIYMGIFKLPAIQDYWNQDPIYPSHAITKFMTLFSFQQISIIINNILYLIINFIKNINIFLN